LVGRSDEHERVGPRGGDRRHQPRHIHAGRHQARGQTSTPLLSAVDSNDLDWIWITILLLKPIWIWIFLNPVPNLYRFGFQSHIGWYYPIWFQYESPPPSDRYLLHYIDVSTFCDLLHHVVIWKDKIFPPKNTFIVRYLFIDVLYFLGALGFQIQIQTNYLYLDVVPANHLDPFGFGFIWTHQSASSNRCLVKFRC